MAKLYKATGEVIDVKPENGKSFTLDEMQKHVGGYIEIVAVNPSADRRCLVVNEEGLLQNLALNATATQLAHTVIVGDALDVVIHDEGTDDERFV